MTYYFDSHVPVCDHEQTYEERTINTKEAFSKNKCLI